MKCKTLIDPSHDEEVLIYAHERTERITEIESFVRGGITELYGQADGSTVRLDIGSIVRFVIEDGKVMAVVRDRHYRLRERLFEIEEALPDGFVKINQSCIARIRCIARFDATIGGALRVSFTNGECDYISRRQLKAVKERLGIK